MSRLEIFRVNEVTTDGRVVLGLDWEHSESFPLHLLGTQLGSYFVGELTNLNRIENRIYADVFADGLDVECVTVDVDRADIDVDLSTDDVIVFTNARLVCGYVNTKGAYPWKDDNA